MEKLLIEEYHKINFGILEVNAPLIVHGMLLLISLVSIFFIFKYFINKIIDNIEEAIEEDVEYRPSINNDTCVGYTKVTYIFKNETVDLINKLALNENLYTEALIEKIVNKYDISKKLKYIHIDEQKDIGTVDAIHIYNVSLKPKCVNTESNKDITKE